ncbi:MAG: hypothetical protein AWM53_01402 [Candidatus Dichloromethanomonas elyunquensis]|nr:MAG: hypothetical protein AWM53_01402 [Candidatus Dichloromethanomonas elyunquensis]
MFSITYGEVSFEEMVALIKAYLSQDISYEYKISIGADSQNFNYTKVPITIGIHKIANKIGKGGIFFSEIRRFSKINNIRQKIFLETSLSLELAIRLREKFKEEKIPNEISVHIDAGLHGPSSQWVSEIRGWVVSCGFPCVIKPDSYMASTIANRLSK